MTPAQRAAALRLAAVPICERSISWQSDATILLRELATVSNMETAEPHRQPLTDKEIIALPAWDELGDEARRRR